MAAEHSTGPGPRALPPNARLTHLTKPQPAPDDYTPRRGQLAMLPNNNHPGSGCSCEACIRRWPEQWSADDDAPEPGDALAAIEIASEGCPAETRAELQGLRTTLGVAHGC